MDNRSLSILVILFTTALIHRCSCQQPDASSDDQSTYKTPSSMMSALIASFTMIVSSEIGDKTFFIAAIMSMRHDRRIVFLGAIMALFVMTVLSAILGSALPALLPRFYTHIAAICLFLVFGLKLLKDALSISDDDLQGEIDETEAEVNAMSSKRTDETDDDDMNELESQTGVSLHRKKSHLALSTKYILTQAFTMTFLAEWGDRSQIATIVMAADSNPYGVVIGGVMGHTFCTLMAVLGGKLLAARISERTVHILGGVLFLFFAVHSIVSGH
uniref:GDT1 family protein n=1 Tax=Spongospora subterranea TaxID=70186 RepID=A0A0H5QHI9_9EUKA|eukprot:CRZ01490.1 hypothetical protein [Spongospora subterranea]